MVVFYKKNDINSGEIVMVEHEVMSPTIPANKDLTEKISYYNENEMAFISLPYELGGDIFNYRICFNDNGEFIGLMPIEN